MINDLHQIKNFDGAKLFRGPVIRDVPRDQAVHLVK